MPNPKSDLSFKEFVCLMACMTGLVALSIDAILPALPEMGSDLKVTQLNDSQLIISFLFLGMAFGQIFFGPLSDRLGRKPAVYIGLALFIVGCILSYKAQSLSTMLMGRIIQGLGLSAPRIVSMALIRDQYKGDTMGKVMSFVMMVFIMVPAIAPALGQFIMKVSHWRTIFTVLYLLGIMLFIWFAWRQRETLKPENRIPFTFLRVLKAIKEVCTNRTSLGYTIAAGFIFAAFLGYLNSVQQIFENQYHKGDAFPLYFAVLALFIGSASFFNGKFVMRFGMRYMSLQSCRTLAVSSLMFLTLSIYMQGQPPFWMLMLYLSFTLFCVGILFSNLSSIAMEPLGHIAGVGASVVGSLSTVIALPFGILIGKVYQNSVTPVISGFTFFGFLMLFLLTWIEKKKTNPTTFFNG